MDTVADPVAWTQLETNATGAYRQPQTFPPRTICGIVSTAACIRTLCRSSPCPARTLCYDRRLTALTERSNAAYRRAENGARAKRLVAESPVVGAART